MTAAFLLSRRYLPAMDKARSTQLDGLRGLLAVSVFIHHASIWYSFLHTGQWSNPESHLFNQLGQSGVTMFFMLSAYLFVTKLLQFKGERFDWVAFYRQRFFRLVPLHSVLVLCIVLIVFAQSNWQLHSSLYELFSSVSKWLGFGMIGFAHINGMDAAPINAGVLWSLSYEWLLYLSLPLLALVLYRSKANWPFILTGAAIIAFTLLYRDYALEHLLSFLGGAIAPFIVKYNTRSISFNHPGFTLLLAACIGGLFLFHSPANLMCKLLITVAFTLVALGNDFFGALRIKPLRLLGEMSYGIYLMHGIVIYSVLHFMVGEDTARALGPQGYCLVLMCLAPVVVLLSFLANRWIEKPWMLRK